MRKKCDRKSVCCIEYILTILVSIGHASNFTKTIRNASSKGLRHQISVKQTLALWKSNVRERTYQDGMLSVRSPMKVGGEVRVNPTVVQLYSFIGALPSMYPIRFNGI